LLKHLKDNKYKADIYSNISPDLIHFYTGKKVYPVPHKLSLATRQHNEVYEENLKKMKSNVINNKAIIAWFNDAYFWYLPRRYEVESFINTKVLKRFKDGVLLEAKN
jgi:hypothetical protein